MKIICLNTWGGRAGKQRLLEFFEEYNNVDVFCLQEVWSAPYRDEAGRTAGGRSFDYDKIMTYGAQDISKILPTHNYFFKPNYLDHYGLLELAKRDLDIVEEGDVFVHKERGFLPKKELGFHARNVQYLTVSTSLGNRSILNFHGLWNGLGKVDTEERLTQSRRIIEFLRTRRSPYVLCGDFNLLPHTESMKMLEEFGLRNLIKEYAISSTRTHLYDKTDQFADYVLVSGDIEILDFRVLCDVVSDHKPMYVEFK